MRIQRKLVSVTVVGKDKRNFKIFEKYFSKFYVKIVFGVAFKIFVFKVKTFGTKIKELKNYKN